MGRNITHAITIFLLTCVVLCGVALASVDPGCEECPPSEVLIYGPDPLLVTPDISEITFSTSGSVIGFNSVTVGNNQVSYGGGAYTANAGAHSLRTNAGASTFSLTTGITTEHATVKTSDARALSYTGTSAIVSDAFYMSRCGSLGDNSFCEDVQGGSSAVIINGQYSTTLDSRVSGPNGIGVDYQYATGPTGNSPYPGLNGEIASQFSTRQEYGQGNTSSVLWENKITTHMNGISAITGSFSFNSWSNEL